MSDSEHDESHLICRSCIMRYDISGSNVRTEELRTLLPHREGES